MIGKKNFILRYCCLNEENFSKPISANSNSPDNIAFCWLLWIQSNAYQEHVTLITAEEKHTQRPIPDWKLFPLFPLRAKFAEFLKLLLRSFLWNNRGLVPTRILTFLIGFFQLLFNFLFLKLWSLKVVALLHDQYSRRNIRRKKRLCVVWNYQRSLVFLLYSK